MKSAFPEAKVAAMADNLTFLPADTTECVKIEWEGVEPSCSVSPSYGG